MLKSWNSVRFAEGKEFSQQEIVIIMLFHSGEKHTELANIDLWESYVIEWNINGDILSIELEAVVLPEHPAYKEPLPDLWACYRKSTLSFIGVQSLEGFDELVSDKPATDASGSKDFGHIEDFQFTRVGDFKFSIELAGTLKFQAKEMKFEIKGGRAL